MSDIGISPEDRERLAKQKFGEFLDEILEERFNKLYDKKQSNVRRQDGQHETANTATQLEHNEQRPPQRRRSLLEECFSQTFGWS